nr:MAG TPA: hypothetical protein [Caudoviricetes sp.]
MCLRKNNKKRGFGLFFLFAQPWQFFQKPFNEQHQGQAATGTKSSGKRCGSSGAWLWGIALLKHQKQPRVYRFPPIPSICRGARLRCRSFRFFL